MKKILMSLRQKFYYYNNMCIPKPHTFVTLPLKSTNIEIEQLAEITAQINQLIPQFSGFIDQFHQIVMAKSINVISDPFGNMSLDVPFDMPDAEGEKLSKKISVIDRLIKTRGQEIDDLLQKGSGLETKIKMKNPNYTSQILDKANEFKKLKTSYKH